MGSIPPIKSRKPATGIREILEGDQLRGANDLFEQAGSLGLCTLRGRVSIILTQRTGESELEETVRRILPHAPLGFGIARPGYRGSRLRVGDDELARR